MQKYKGTFYYENYNFFKKNTFSKISFYDKLCLLRGIFWTLLTCLINLEFSEHLLFANLNDFSLKSTDFIQDSQMQVVFFCIKIFLQKSYFHKKIFYA